MRLPMLLVVLLAICGPPSLASAFTVAAPAPPSYQRTISCLRRIRKCAKKSSRCCCWAKASNNDNGNPNGEELANNERDSTSSSSSSSSGSSPADFVKSGLDLFVPGADSDPQESDGANTTARVVQNETMVDDKDATQVLDDDDQKTTTTTTIMDPLLDMVTVPDWADSFFSGLPTRGLDDDDGTAGTITDHEQDQGEEEEIDQRPTSASDIIQNLLRLLSVVQRRTVRDLRWFDVLLLNKVSKDMRVKYPEYREELYHEGAEQVGIAKNELRDLSDAVKYARWAYTYSDEDTDDEEEEGEATLEDLKRRMKDDSFLLLRDEAENTGPGMVGHYIAISPKKKVALIGLKGTSGINDLITDALGNAVPYTLDGPFSRSYHHQEVRCHEGMLLAALSLADEMEHLVRDLFLPAGYRIILSGHSLGAGTASLLGMTLRSRIPALRKRRNRRALHVYAIATPAVTNYEAALACAPFVTSVVNGADVVPRLSVTNLVNMGELLDMVDHRVEELKAEGVISEGFHKAMSTFQNVMELEEFLSPDELEEFLGEIHGRIGHDDEECLYVPGRVVAIYEKGLGGGAEEQIQLSNEEETVEAGEQPSGSKEFGVVVGDGGMRMLRFVEVASTMLYDHRAVCYEENIKTLLEQQPPQVQVMKTKKRGLWKNAGAKLRALVKRGRQWQMKKRHTDAD